MIGSFNSQFMSLFAERGDVRCTHAANGYAPCSLICSLGHQWPPSSRRKGYAPVCVIHAANCGPTGIHVCLDHIKPLPSSHFCPRRFLKRMALCNAITRTGDLL